MASSRLFPKSRNNAKSERTPVLLDGLIGISLVVSGVLYPSFEPLLLRHRSLLAR